MEKKKDRPGDLRREMNRVRQSRATLRKRNLEKTAMNKKLRDRNVELAERGDRWRAQSYDQERQLKEIREELERERERANQERERADKLQSVKTQSSTRPVSKCKEGLKPV
jgi:chromosome segregation ATPase